MSSALEQFGEGFAFFRWHCLRYPTVNDCRGLADKNSQCKAEWKHPAEPRRVIWSATA